MQNLKTRSHLKDIQSHFNQLLELFEDLQHQQLSSHQILFFKLINERIAKLSPEFSDPGPKLYPSELSIQLFSTEISGSSHFIEYALYKKLIDECGIGVKKIIFYANEDPFIHPRLTDMIRYARNFLIKIAVRTPLISMNDAFIETIFQSEIDHLIIGPSDKKLEGLPVEIIIENLLRILIAKDQAGVISPHMEWRYSETILKKVSQEIRKNLEISEDSKTQILGMINWDGSVRSSSSHLVRSAGNIRVKPFLTIWNSAVFKVLKKREDWV